MANTRTYRSMIRDRWSTRPAFIIFYLLSPTLFFADYRKYRAGPEKAAVTQSIKNLNLGFLCTTSACTVALIFLDVALPSETGFVAHKIVVGVPAIYALSRCNEIFVAFIRDATSHLRPGETTTDLKYYERIGLAMRSYLELVLAYALVFRGISEIVGGFIPPLDALSAVYFSGVTITTIGYGDIRPTHWLPRLLTVYEVFNGVSLIVVSFTVYVSRSIDAREFKNGSGNGSA